MNNSKITLASTIDADLLDITIPSEPSDFDDESSDLHFDCVDVGRQRDKLYYDELYCVEIDPAEYLAPEDFLSPEEYKEYLKRKQDEPPKSHIRTSTDGDLKDMPF